MKTLFLSKIDCEHLLQTFLDEKHYDVLLEEDCDVYRKDPFDNKRADEENIILKFRKNWFSDADQIGAYDGLKEAAKQSQNRGVAAGPKGKKLQGREWLTPEQREILKFLSKVETLPIPQDIETLRARAKKDPECRGEVWLTSETKKHDFDWNRWLRAVVTFTEPEDIRKAAKWVLDTFISDTSYANPVESGVAGYFGRYPRIPYGRATSYTAHNYDKFQLSFPFLQKLSLSFYEMLPNRFANQLECAKKLDPEFVIPGTVFTTITVNKNFRTAAHRDAGDLNSGFSNLSVVAKNKNYQGGYLILPEIRAAVNLRPGDLLLVNNHEYIHGNTPITGDDHERISLVCYFREDMLELGTKEYEDARYDFVEHRRKDPNHVLARDGWNGVSQSMFETKEWYDFLRSRHQEHLITKTKSYTTLEELFE